MSSWWDDVVCGRVVIRESSDTHKQSLLAWDLLRDVRAGTALHCLLLYGSPPAMCSKPVNCPAQPW